MSYAFCFFRDVPCALMKVTDNWVTKRLASLNKILNTIADLWKEENNFDFKKEFEKLL